MRVTMQQKVDLVFKFFSDLFLFYVLVLCLHVCLREDADSPGAGIPEISELPMWVLCPLEEQTMLLTTEPFLIF